jgi:ABC-type polysaccharide/polyol phosphate transport system ATPase subunit
MPSSDIAVTVENVTQRFRLIHERPDTLRELFSRFFQGKVSYQDFEALSGISFQVKRGEMLGIIGRNGSGKSTLLKVIAGIYKPTVGHVQVNGTLAPLLELGAGFHHELTGRENILLNGLLLGFSKNDMKLREKKIIEFAELGDFIDVPVKQYSSGMYMRLAFSVATEVNPEILLVDEILAVGDLAFQQKCLARLQEFRRSGKTILFVTHSPVHIRTYCDRVVVLGHGRMLHEGDTEQGLKVYEWSSASPAETGVEPEARLADVRNG